MKKFFNKNILIHLGIAFILIYFWVIMLQPIPIEEIDGAVVQGTIITILLLSFSTIIYIYTIIKFYSKK